MTIPEAAKLMEKCCAVCLDPGSFEEDEEGEQVLEAMLTALKSLGGFKANLTRLKTTAVWTEQGPQTDEEKEQWWEVFVSWLSRQDIPLSEVAKQRVGIPGLGQGRDASSRSDLGRDASHEYQRSERRHRSRSRSSTPPQGLRRMKNLGIRVTFPKYSGERGGMADWWLIMKTKFELMKLSEEEQSLVVLDSLSSEAHAVFMASLKEGQNTEDTDSDNVRFSSC